MKINYSKIPIEELSELSKTVTDYSELELINQHLRKRLYELGKLSKKINK